MRMDNWLLEFWRVDLSYLNSNERLNTSEEGKVLVKLLKILLLRFNQRCHNEKGKKLIQSSSTVPRGD